MSEKQTAKLIAGNESGLAFLAHAQNQQTIANGQITLYQRDDVEDALRQCRIKIKGHSGYVSIGIELGP